MGLYLPAKCSVSGVPIGSILNMRAVGSGGTDGLMSRGRLLFTGKVDNVLRTVHSC